MQAQPIVKPKEASVSSFKEFIKNISTVGVVSALTKTITAPLERLKIIYQAQQVLTINSRAKIYSFKQYIEKVPKSQGFFSFWRGNLTNIIEIIPQTIIQYFCYDNIRHSLFPKGDEDGNEIENYIKKIVCGITCGFISVSVVYPFDTIKTRLSLEFQKNKSDRLYKGFFQTISEINEREQIYGLFKGYLVAQFTSMQYSIFFYLFLDLVKYSATNNDSIYQYAKHIGLATTAGLLTQLTLYPLETLRRRLQINGYNRFPIYSSSIDCLQKILNKEGMNALYKGITVSSVKYILAALTQAYLLRQIFPSKSQL